MVGSGGSVTAADFIVRLHHSFARLPALVLTPYEFILRSGDELSAVLLLSAGGGNPDIVNAARHASEAAYPAVASIIGRARSPLATQLSQFRHAQSLELELPVSEDPLGANSLLATVTLLSRAYSSVFTSDLEKVEPPTLSKEIEGPALDSAVFCVLAAGWTTPAALHLTSESNEAGLGIATVTDYRNFAHGGHHVLARRGDESTVVAFIDPDCRDIATATLDLLPGNVRTVRIETEKRESSAAIELLMLSMELVERITAQAQGDRGQRPVTAFGKNLYQLDISKHHRSNKVHRSDRIDLWIQRKVGGAVWARAGEDDRNAWRGEYEKWASLQRVTNVGGIVFDYDGTICEIDERYSGPGTAIAAALTGILERGIPLGVASGRGRSVVKALQAVLPETHWKNVTVGPYNGGLLTSLADPYPTNLRSTELMSETGKILKASPLITALANISYSGPHQVTLVEKKPFPPGVLRRMVVEILAERDILESVSVQSSGLAVDIIENGASKRRVVDHLARQLGDSSQAVFSIGDQGAFGGNDFTLLADSHSLSVYRVSARFDQCWNLARPGRRGSVAFIDYLDAIVPREGSSGMFVFDIDSLESA